MNRLLALFIAFFLLNNCSFNENSRIWKEKDKDLSKKENVKKIFAEEQVKASDSGDIIAALRGQVSTEPMQNPAPTQEPVNIPQSPQPIDVDLETTSTLPSNLVDSTAAEPTQLAKEGGVKSRDEGGFLDMITNPIRKNIAENLQPYGYDNPIKRLFNAARGKKDQRRPDSEKFGYHPDYMWWAVMKICNMTPKEWIF